MCRIVIKSRSSSAASWNLRGHFMKNGMGSLLLALIAFLLTVPMGAPAQQPKTVEGGLPWAYGFATPAPVAPAPAPTPGAAAAPAAPADDRDSIRHLPGT